MNAWIEAGVAMGELDIPDFNQNPRKYLKITARRTNKIDIEPVKTATANEQKLANNSISLKDVAEDSGKNAEQVIMENLELEQFEMQKREELGLIKEEIKADEK